MHIGGVSAQSIIAMEGKKGNDNSHHNIHQKIKQQIKP